MGHPLAPDLTKLSQDQLNENYSKLITQLNAAHRFGRTDVVGQIQMLLQDYQEEINNRNQKAMEDMQKAMEKNSKNFKNIIDIQ
jgi:hypothetical protein